VIDLKTKQRIILLRQDGKSLREIAAELHISKNTVADCVRNYEKARDKLLKADPDMDPEEIIQDFMEAPKYDTSSRGKRKATPEIMEAIRECLNENREKRLTGRTKQQMKKIDIYDHLKQMGFQVSYSTVKGWIREMEDAPNEAFIRQEYQPGEVVEFDWGEVKLKIGSDKAYKTYQMAVFTAAYSNYRYAVLFRRQDTAAFQESHALFFEHCHGVFHTVVYDNMKVAVKRFVGPSDKEPTEALLQLYLYYGFRFRFCNVRSGNEKGHVERSVEFVRRKAFSAKGADAYDSLESANRALAETVNKLNRDRHSLPKAPITAMLEEKANLIPVTAKMNCFMPGHGKADKYSTISVDSNHYSVPEKYVRKQLSYRIYNDRISFYDGSQRVASHPRCFGKGQWIIDIFHYLKTLERKPGALHQSTALLRADATVKKIYDVYYSNDPKTFLQVLLLIREKGADAVEKALKRLSTISPLDYSADKVRAICDENASAGFTLALPAEPAHDTAAAPQSSAQEDVLSIVIQGTLSQYDRAMEISAEYIEKRASA